jgi:putative hemolysin
MSPGLVAVTVVIIFAGASFFFALAETALFSLSKWQVQQLAQRRPNAGSTVMRLLGEAQDVLATMVLGNTFASAAMLATALWMGLNGYWPLAGTIPLLLVLTLIGCEVLPKTLAVRHPEKWALRVARPMSLLQKLATPFRRIAQMLNNAILAGAIPGHVKPQKSTDAEYQELVELAFQQGALAQSEKEIILQIIQLDRRAAKDVMKPRSQMAAIPDDLSVEQMIEAARKYKHRRLPIYDETPDTIVGILNTRAMLLDPSIDLSEAIDFPSFVPESMNLLQLLKSLQRQKRGMAMVMDEFGGTAGIVTTEDILQEVVGRIRGDSVGESLLFEKLGPGKWRMSGGFRLDDFRREFPEMADVPEVETMGGLMVHVAEVVPAAGESVTFRGFKLTAQASDERRVKELIVEKVK